jgi:cyanophycinase-like exopeptidase
VSLPRLLVIMGSGETSPTMVKTHRELLARLGPDPGGAVMLNTPFGFQENADDIGARAVEYFRVSVNEKLDIAEFRSSAGAANDPVGYETMLGDLRRATYVFAGPGSPSYALRQWTGSPVPDILRDKLRTGGCVTFASAAALTLGVKTVPVYEVYKVGEDPHWLDGLDLLAETGLRAAVIPHYDNAEGGNHDTRFCYLGERRLARLEAELPSDAFVLGVDEHTGCILDLDAGTAAVVGLGQVTVRKDGRSVTLPAATTVPITRLTELASSSPPAVTGAPTMTAATAAVGVAGQTAVGVAGQTAAGVAGQTAAGVAGQTAVGVAGQSAGSSSTGGAVSPLLTDIARLEAEFDAALAAKRYPDATRAVLDLDDLLLAWSRDTLQSDEADRGRAARRGMIVRLGQQARDPRELLAPYIDLLLALRSEARAAKRWEDADAVRDRLTALGVEIHDTSGATEWDLPLLS